MKNYQAPKIPRTTPAELKALVLEQVQAAPNTAWSTGRLGEVLRKKVRPCPFLRSEPYETEDPAYLRNRAITAYRKANGFDPEAAYLGHVDTAKALDADPAARRAVDERTAEQTHRTAVMTTAEKEFSTSRIASVLKKLVAEGLVLRSEATTRRTRYHSTTQIVYLCAKPESIDAREEVKRAAQAEKDAGIARVERILAAAKDRGLEADIVNGSIRISLSDAEMLFDLETIA